jgi:hypothetical protein
MLALCLEEKKGEDIMRLAAFLTLVVGSLAIAIIPETSNSTLVKNQFGLRDLTSWGGYALVASTCPADTLACTGDSTGSCCPSGWQCFEAAQSSYCCPDGMFRFGPTLKLLQTNCQILL